MGRKKGTFQEARKALEKLEGDAFAQHERHWAESRDGEGFYHIVVNVPSEEDLYNPYSGKKALSDGIYSWIESRAEDFPTGAPIAVDFILPEGFSEEEPVRSMYRSHYLFSYTRLERDERRMRIAIFAMVLLGSLFLIGASIVGAFKDGASDNLPLYLFLLVLGEILGVGDWVLFWESFDKIFFEETGRKGKRLLVERLILAPLTFDKAGSDAAPQETL